MAKKNVVRHDVVQIEWEIESNPFAGITDALNELKSDIVGAVAKMKNEFNDAAAATGNVKDGVTNIAKSVNELSNGAIGSVADDMKSINEQAAKAAPKVSGVTRELSTLAKTKVGGIFDGIKNIPTAPITKVNVAVEKLKNGFLKIKNISLSDVGKGLGKGIKVAYDASKKLLSALVKVAAVSFDKLKNGLKGVASGLASAGKAAAKGLGNATVMTTKALGRAVVGLGAGAVAAGAGIFKLTDMASNMSETTNKVMTVFGDTTGAAVQTWANDSIKNMGVARQSALDMTALFGDMGTSMGIPQGEAANMSMSLAQLGADLSSFKNIDINQATTALNGIFTGEGESLKQLGVVMSQTSLDAFAMANGYGKVTKDMTEAEKVQLRYAFVMEKTKNAQGDFAKTGGGFANQLRMAKEQVKEMGTNIGGIFLPSMEQGIRAVNGFATELNGVFVDGWQDGDMTKISEILNRAIGEGAKAIQTELPKIIGFLVPALNMIVEIIIRELPAILKILLQGVMRLFTGIIDMVKKNKSTIVASVISLGKELVMALLTLVPELLLLGAELLVSLLDGIAKQLPTLIPMAITAINKLLSGIVTMLPRLIDSGMKILMALLDGLMVALPQILDATLTIIMALANGIMANLPKIIDVAIQIIMTLVNFIIDNLPAIIEVAIQIIIALVQGLCEAIPQLLAAVPKIVMALIEGLMTVNWLQVGLDIIGAIGKGIVGGLKSLFGGGEKVGKSANQGVTQGLSASAYMPETAATKNATNVATALTPSTAALTGAGKDTMSSYSSGLNIGSTDCTTTAQNTANSVQSNLSVDGYGQGKATAQSYSSGLASGTQPPIDTTAKLTSQEKTVKETEVMQKLGTDTVSFDSLEKASTTASNDCVKTFDTSFKEIVTLVTAHMKEVAAVISQTNLYDAGKNMMRSFNDGILSMRDTILATAAEIATSVNAVAGGLPMPVNNPAVTPPIGAATPQTLYTPEGSQVTPAVSTSEVNNYNPQFNLTVQGGCNDRDTERKVKGWIKEALRETFDSMGRRNPKITEV